MFKSAVAVRHVQFEDLGAFEEALLVAGYSVRTCDLGMDGPQSSGLAEADLLVVLGGPVGVYEHDRYPVLAQELDVLRARLADNRPTLGICLGAQLMAAALGGAVAPTGHKEIGFSPITLTREGAAGPLRHLADAPVLHWHGDMFEIPDGAARLAQTDLCVNQAFSRGPNILGLQFHAEVDASAGFERWLIGHACELAAAGIDPRRLRAEATTHGAALREAGRAMLSEWLGGLMP